MSDVVVVGGGVVGLAIAWQAAAVGLSVTLCDPEPGRGASWVAAGMLASVSEATFGEEPLARLAVDSAGRWPAFAEALELASGEPTTYRRCGTLQVALDRDDLGELMRLQEYRGQLGLPSERLRSRELRLREPTLSPNVRGGVHVPGDHAVDPRAVTRALLIAAERAGVVLRRVRVTGLDERDGRAVGVRLGDGTTADAGQVVLAAGAATGAVLGAGRGPVVRPVKGQLLRLAARDGDPVLAGNVRALVRGRSVYLVPRGDGRLVVGATVEEQGADTTVTAGAVRQLLDDAVEVVPQVDELELVETLAGLRPGTPDNAPVIGRAEPDGLILATGHYRNGVLLTPLTAELVTRLLLGHDPPELAPFAPLRDGAAQG